MPDQISAPIDFEARFDKALKNLEDFVDRVDKRTKETSKGFGFLETAAKAFVAKFTVDRVIEGLKAVTEKATEAEEASRRLGLQLAATGSNTDKNVRLFKEFAKEIERTSRYDDDLILSQVAVAKQYGVTNKEAVKLIRTAVDLAEVTGDDLTSTVRQLGQTLDGTAGRFAQQFPILQGLTAAQLRNGAAIEILGKQYKGAAESGLNSFAGRSANLAKSIGNLEEAIGLIIIRNPELLDNMAKLTDTIVRLTETVENGGGAIGRFFKVLTAPNLGVLSRVFDALNTTTNAIVRSFTGGTEAAKKLGDSAKGASKGVDALGKSAKTTGYNFDESTIKVDRFANEAIQKFEALSKQLEDVGRTELDTLTNQYLANKKIIERQLNSGYGDRRRAEELLGKLELKYVREAGELRKKQYEEIASQIQTVYQNPIKAFSNSPDTNKLSSGERAVAGAAGIGKSALTGAEGARSLLAAGVSAAAEAYLGPAGRPLGDLAAELSKGPENAKKMISEFADAIPDLVVNLVAALQEAVIVIVDKLPDIIEKLIERAPEIIERLIANLPRLFAALAKSFIFLPFIVARAIIKALGGLGKIFLGFGASILKGASRFVSEILKGAGRFIQELIKGIGKSVGGIFGGGGKGGIGGFISGIGKTVGGAVKSIGRAIGLKTGGEIGTSLIDSGSFVPQIAPPVQSKAGGTLQPIVLQIGNKQLASAIVDLQKLGFQLA